MIRVTQSWDDGVHDDARLVGLLRKHKAKATFNLISGAYRAERYDTNWQHEGHAVFMLARPELMDLFHDFEVASHTVTHPHLEAIPADKVVSELSDSRRQLEDIFQRPIHGFAYPFGSYNDAVREEVRRQGYVYARNARSVPDVFPPVDPMEFGATTHVLNPRFWDEFERVKAQDGVFHFWGHSYEFLNETMWNEFEEKLVRLNAEPGIQWLTNLDLFTGK